MLAICLALPYIAMGVSGSEAVAPEVSTRRLNLVPAT
jgi:hypothetical protein